uniref:SH3 domain-containing protein n=1 Tax=Globodera rostochiensis TaxID=31243 RepID=A0A914GXY7_GLORO
MNSDNGFDGTNEPQEFSTHKPMLVIAKHSFEGRNNDELSFNKNNVISVTQKLDGGWLTGWPNWLVPFQLRRNCARFFIKTRRDCPKA